MHRLVILAVFLVSGVVFSTGWHGVSAQNSCDDPFSDVARLRFDRGYWDKTDFCQHSVPYDDIRSGGPPPDGIPPIDDPQFESVDAASAWLQPQSPVIAVEIDGEAKAYPLAILTWHEIANDSIAGIPVAVTFCPLCNASVVYDRRVDGVVLRFGVSGNLRNSDMIMWDDQTQSWWQQFTGEGIVGVHTGTRLELLPSQVVGFGDFAARYPGGAVLARDTGIGRRYGTNPYVGYDGNPRPFLFDGQLDDRLPATERVLGAMIAGESVAYPFSLLTAQRVINDSIGTRDVVAFWQGGVASALDGADIDSSIDIGTAALFSREVDGSILSFRVDETGVIRDEQTGSAWNIFGEATEGQLAGSRLDLLFAAQDFWFAWAAFRPETAIYGQP
jgi:hypothetical protein